MSKNLELSNQFQKPFAAMLARYQTIFGRICMLNTGIKLRSVICLTFICHYLDYRLDWMLVTQ